jgi:hypothetical protein
MSGLVDLCPAVRSLRKVYFNGLDELVLGLFFCAISGTSWLGFSMVGSESWRKYSMIAMYLPAVCSFAMALTLKTLRAKLIFPRTGYVEFRPPGSRKWVMFVLMFVGLGLIATIFAVTSGALQMPDMSRVTGPAASLVFGACFVPLGITYKLPRFFWLAGWSLILGAVTYVTDARVEGVMWVMVGIGAAMAGSGAIRLRGFLGTHPIIEDHA